MQIIHILSMLALLLPLHAIDWQGNWAFDCDFNDQDMSNQKSSGENCGGLCARTSGCTHFTWSNYNGGTCWMKSGPATKNDAFPAAEGLVCGVMEGQPQPGGGGIHWQGNWAQNCDFNDQDMSNQRSSSEDCGGLCARTPGCTHFTWSNYNGGTCWMKSGPATKNDANPAAEGLVCGVIEGQPQPGGGGINWQGNWAQKCDFKDQDMSNQQSSSEDCGGLCARTSGCTHFTWSNYNGGTCWMKNGRASKNDAIPAAEGLVCGVIEGQPQPGGGGQPGTTTRYWDCCKSSCAWGGKASSGAYVKSCRKDGTSVFGINYAKNGCEGGGEAFVCNDNQPWAVNDQLAYGFAATTQPGLSEQQLCCTCYKLNFDGALSGKSMIVQVVNSGSDVRPGQFDLQIPGGGVGIFNGCSSQWGAPGDGWGQRYGGVSNVGQCDQLPAQIRDGCKFRFGWFRGADNPTMNYQKVDCPQELIQKTGCRA